ncbi:MAG TPA: CPBP family intramembrane glutamic endopeptidase [Pyrinomonadaceae bacterium]|nr:CPBP family intramembrane glutamic endopeptidase [Pyrinomonadaceae bacterium]
MFPFVYEINPAGWLHLLNFGLALPLVAISQARRFAQADKPLPQRIHHFRRTAATLVLFGGLSLLVARFEWIDLFPRALPPWRAIGAGVLMFVVAVAAMRPRWRRAVERGARVVYLFMPANPAERAWWIVVAVLAGVSEEITWRGVQAGLAYKLLGNVTLAFVLCAVSFGVGHIIQGWKSAILISVFALAFHLLVWLSGSLYVAMAVHIAYDITAGINYGRLGRELGYRPEVKTAPPAAVSELATLVDE